MHPRSKPMIESYKLSLWVPADILLSTYASLFKTEPLTDHQIGRLNPSAKLPRPLELPQFFLQHPKIQTLCIYEGNFLK